MSNILNEHEIHKVLESHPDDGWQLLQEGRIEPSTLEVLPENPENIHPRDTVTVARIGHVAEKGADIHRPIAA